MNCLACHSDHIENCGTGNDFEYHSVPDVFKMLRCKNCGLVFLNPMPDRDIIQKFYTKDYYTINPHSPLFLKGFIYEIKQRGDLKRIIPIVRQACVSSVLDLGCGDAQRLINLRLVLPNLKIKLVGIDLHFSESVKKKSKVFGIDLFEGNIEDFDFSRSLGVFDLILMNQLLEHLRFPEQFIQQLHYNLKPLSRILIETPNPGGVDFLLFRSKFWGGYHIPRHLYIFSRKSLELLLKKYNYLIEKKGYLPSPGFWIISLRNKLGLNSKRRSNSFGEFFSFHNIFIVSFFTIFDIFFSFFYKTSNQYIIVRKI